MELVKLEALKIPAGHSMCFVEGWRAAEAGEHISDNPYIPDGVRNDHWKIGFDRRIDLEVRRMLIGADASY